MPAVFFTFPLSHCEATKYGAEKDFAAACLLMKRACPGLSRKSMIRNRRCKKSAECPEFWNGGNFLQ